MHDNDETVTITEAGVNIRLTSLLDDGQSWTFPEEESDDAKGFTKDQFERALKRVGKRSKSLERARASSGT